MVFDLKHNFNLFKWMRYWGNKATYEAIKSRIKHFWFFINCFGGLRKWTTWDGSTGSSGLECKAWVLGSWECRGVNKRKLYMLWWLSLRCLLRLRTICASCAAAFSKSSRNEIFHADESRVLCWGYPYSRAGPAQKYCSCLHIEHPLTQLDVLLAIESCLPLFVIFAHPKA